MDTKKITIFTISATAIIVVCIVLLVFWRIINVGNIMITSNQFNVEYSLDGDWQHAYEGEAILDKIIAGGHTINAREKSSGYFYPKDIYVNVQRGKTTEIDVVLDPRDGSPDVSGEEYGF